MSDSSFFRKYLDIISEAPQMSAREADMQRRMAATRGAATNVAPGTSQTTTGPAGTMTVSKSGPANINPTRPAPLAQPQSAAIAAPAQAAPAGGVQTVMANRGAGQGLPAQDAQPAQAAAPVQAAASNGLAGTLPSQGAGAVQPAGGGFSATGRGSVDFEESLEEEELQKILRLSGKQKQKTNENNNLENFYNLLNESTEEDFLLYDSFDIELNEHFVIETGIVGFTDDGIILEGDDTLLGLLEVNDIMLEEGELVTEGLRDPKDNPCWKGYKPVGTKKKNGKTVPNCVPKESVEESEELEEAEYQGRKVPLGKPMAGDVKKSKVYVRKPNGKVVKVNFGDKKMKIKKSNPKRRKSFRARHNCANPGPRWKARYWSCRAW